MTTTNCPVGTVNDTPSTARTSGPPGAENVTVALWSWSIWLDPAGYAIGRGMEG
jgi:hypothetical protein